MVHGVLGLMVLVRLILSTNRHILNNRTLTFDSEKLISGTGMGKRISHTGAWGICDEKAWAK